MAEPGNTEQANVDYNKEYVERFSKAKTRAEEKGFRYEYPNRAGIGWKIHLNVPPIATEKITSDIVVFLKGKRFFFKVGRSSGQEGKGMTIYVGDRDTMEDLANELDTLFGGKILPPVEETLTDDIPVVGKVRARFENVGHHLKDQFGEDKYHQYGSLGVPYLLKDVRKSLYEEPDKRPTTEQRAKDATTALVKDYGAFFTGTRNHPISIGKQNWVGEALALKHYS